MMIIVYTELDPQFAEIAELTEAGMHLQRGNIYLHPVNNAESKIYFDRLSHDGFATCDQVGSQETTSTISVYPMLPT